MPNTFFRSNGESTTKCIKKHNHNFMYILNLSFASLSIKLIRTKSAVFDPVEETPDSTSETTCFNNEVVLAKIFAKPRHIQRSVNDQTIF